MSSLVTSPGFVRLTAELQRLAGNGLVTQTAGDGKSLFYNNYRDFTGATADLAVVAGLARCRCIQPKLTQTKGQGTGTGLAPCRGCTPCPEVIHRWRVGTQRWALTARAPRVPGEFWVLILTSSSTQHPA